MPTDIEHSFCPGCGAIDGAAVGNFCDYCTVAHGSGPELIPFVHAADHRRAISLLGETATELRAAADLVDGSNLAWDLRTLADRLDAERGQ
jgi:hypothetical protein